MSDDKVFRTLWIPNEDVDAVADPDSVLANFQVVAPAVWKAKRWCCECHTGYDYPETDEGWGTRQLGENDYWICPACTAAGYADPPGS